MKSNFLIKLFSTCLLLPTSFATLSHAGHGTQAPWQACEEKQLNQTCSYESHDAKATGTCQAMNQVLMCVRNQPLEKLLPKPTEKVAESNVKSVKAEQHDH
ncbi:hypothetical protein NQT69_04195 [Pseudoalteromonas shioyasakiensis]|uniref:hypothetical protein n=1 Tax=Pseudoalteromonas shioyasakiensis TaxID=1190813 RepID=UPI002118B68A|nr:hypothetical protein [Pseudoalteromonas shioyasakiensis]MCQ8877241.1 hypothetical protein [Pseudoalteromonas shioyasakiensis]